MSSNEAISAIRARVEALESQFSNICRIGGTPGLSLVAIHRGEVIYSNHFGHRDVQANELPDGETIYYVASLTKAMVAALIGILVEERLLDWTTPICYILPELKGTLEGRGSHITIVDLLSHRAGVARSDALWLQRAGNVLISKTQGIDTWTSQPLVRDFRADYLYNNFGYDMLGRAIEKLTGKSVGTNFKEKLFGPLGMTRTSLEDDASTRSNAAKAYFTLDDGSPVEVPVPTLSDKTFMAAAGSVRSCTNDLTKFYTSFMHAANDQFLNKTTNTQGSPFKQLLRILQPHSQLTIVSLREQSYALGWVRAELPCTLGALNYNQYLVPAMPIIGKNAASRLVVYHAGSLQGFTSSVYLLPETETAVFALQNSTALCDPCDWIPQLVMQTIFGHGRDLIDFEKFAKTAAATGAGLADAIEKQLQYERLAWSKPKLQKLTAYVGRYRNKANTFHIDIVLKEDGELYMCFQGLENETYRLRHYHGEVFVWNLSHNETARQGRFQTLPHCSYKIAFHSVAYQEGGGKINHLSWMYDDALLEPPVFVREEVTS